MSKGKISIILPYFNGKEFIKEALDSILKQTYTNFEIILIDDGSSNPLHSDYLKALVENYGDERIKYFYKNNEGLSRTRNFGIDNSNGEYLAFIDQDDIWKINKLEIQMNIMKTINGVSAITTNGEAFGETNFILNPGRKFNLKTGFVKESYAKMLRANFADICTLLVRRELLKDIGYCNRKYIVTPDYEYLIRIAEKTDFYYVNDSLYFYRFHANNTVKDIFRLYSEVLCILYERPYNNKKEKYQSLKQFVAAIIKIIILFFKK